MTKYKNLLSLSVKEERNKLECFISRQVFKSSLIFHVRPCALVCMFVCVCGWVCVCVGVGVWVFC